VKSSTRCMGQIAKVCHLKNKIVFSDVLKISWVVLPTGGLTKYKDKNIEGDPCGL
jgi:hypothetical protein